MGRWIRYYELRKGQLLHRYPSWMSLKLHIILEKLIEKTPRIAYSNRFIRLINNFFHGIVCGYSLPDILRFLGYRSFMSTARDRE